MLMQVYTRNCSSNYSNCDQMCRDEWWHDEKAKNKSKFHGRCKQNNVSNWCTESSEPRFLHFLGSLILLLSKSCISSKESINCSLYMLFSVCQLWWEVVVNWILSLSWHHLREPKGLEILSRIVVGHYLSVQASKIGECALLVHWKSLMFFRLFCYIKIQHGCL